MPIDIEKQPLKLPREIEDYTVGQVPPDVLPTVWPDPHFIAAQVLKIWPRHEPTQVALAVEVPARNANEPALSEPPERPNGVSDKDWETYVFALERGYDLRIHGKITSAARSIAQSRGHSREFQSERRALHRVRKKINEQRSTG